MKAAALFLLLAACLSAAGSVKEILPSQIARERLEATGYRGTVLIYDLTNDAFSASHPDIADERFIPASTFKILSSQAALQSGTIESKDSILKWDGIARSRPETNRDLDLTSAFRISSVPHFQDLVRQIGESRMQAFVDSIPYGNQKITGGIDTFWLTGDLRISPREQIEFLLQLYKNDLPFDPAVMTAVKEMMLAPAKAGTAFSSKTGWATLPQNRNIGWFVGWAERDNSILFFATILDTNAPQDDFGKTRINLTEEILDLTFPTQFQ